ncbi:CoA ester lyase [Microvirga sp. SRT01]|uniref:CoA ester lyase n=1 Tax=Sphingomonas longa TaxID=2778730 RepID=A0ABS2DCM4_9SPHN|nr:MULTISPECIES: CoA ester lyase [Alphaproteobacteria]MBM6577829.1 CoA ester lyase [Sphingomonas sp. BT552]MBR7710871.1 CoA ester lyase [Microvirga sp. SRT01]
MTPAAALARPIRSMLFVPGNRASWIDKAAAAKADALVLDLEDSVPVAAKVEARVIVADAVARHDPANGLLYVRTNPGTYMPDWDDVQAVVQPGLNGLFVAKVQGPEDVEVLARLVAEAEHRRGMAIGSIGFVVALETARAAELAFAIASHPRVQTLVSSAARNADVARALGFTWSAEGLETLYFRSKTIIACRAAGKPFPIGGLWQDVHDLEGMRRFSAFNRQLGYTGEIVLHPSNVTVANEAYSLSEQDRDYFAGMIAAFAEAEAQGKAAVIYRGEHVDIAHVETARETLRIHGGHA